MLLHTLCTDVNILEWMEEFNVYNFSIRLSLLIKTFFEKISLSNESN